MVRHLREREVHDNHRFSTQPHGYAVKGDLTNKHQAKGWLFVLLLLLAGVWRSVVFGFGLLNFWLLLIASAILLAGGVTLLHGPAWTQQDWTGSAIILGIGSGLVFYAVCLVGGYGLISAMPEAQVQLADIYSLVTNQLEKPLLFALVLIIAPCEEIFWRGFILQGFQDRFGNLAGLLLATLCYSAIHLASGNIILTIAAAIAALFFGGLTYYEHSIVPAIMAHTTWLLLTFAFLPLV